MSFDGLYDASDAPPLMADFYREPDNVVRGISLEATHFDFDSYSDACGVAFSGLGPWEPSKFSEQTSRFIELPSKSHEEPLKVIDASTEAGPTLQGFKGSHQRFTKRQEGRKVPEDPFFYMERTTQFLPGVCASEAGNHVLDVLDQGIESRILGVSNEKLSLIESRILKVSNEKLSFRAEAFHSGRDCQMKVYIYQQESGCAVEFQRRSGDSVLFWDVYQKASEYLCKHTDLQPSLGYLNANRSEMQPAENTSEMQPPDSLLNQGLLKSVVVWLQGSRTP